MEEASEPTLNEKAVDQDHKTNGYADNTDSKKEAILKACEVRNLADLRALAESPGGFLTDNLRQKAWPILLGISPISGEGEHGQNGSASTFTWETLPPHKDEDQVQLDVNRAFIYYPDHQTEQQLAQQKSALSSLILSVLRTHPYLCYFQGYHDIAQVLLLTLSPTSSSSSSYSPSPPPLHHQPTPLQHSALTHLSLLHIRDFMLPSLQPAIAQLHLLPQILRLADPPLHAHLSAVHARPFFALAGTLTMYAHDITSRGAVARLFDFLLARDPAASLYLFAAAVRARRAELFAVPPDEPDVLHSILSRLPAPLDLEALIAEAVRLEREFPPERLPGWRSGGWMMGTMRGGRGGGGGGISRWSVLKTAREGRADGSGSGSESGNGGKRVQSLEEGRMFFERQVAELRWAEKKERARQWLWRNRGPARAVGIAVLVGVLAVLLRRGSVPGPLVSGLGYLSGLLATWWR